MTGRHRSLLFAPQEPLGSLLRLRMLALCALVSTTVLAVLVALHVGPWIAVFSLVPLGLAWLGLRRFRGARRTYDQTLVAMSRIPEAFGPVPDGHAERVAVRVRSAAQHLGLPARLIAAAERAARLHEVGRITIEDDRPMDPDDVRAAAGRILRDAEMDELVVLLLTGDPADLRRPSRQAARLIQLACDLDLIIGTQGLERDRAYEVLSRTLEIDDVRLVSALAAADGAGVPA